MRGEADRDKLERLMAAIGERATGSGVIYLTGGATALLFGWRNATIDIDIKPDPTSSFPRPDWRERSIFIATHGPVSFFHYDLYSQALAKLQRGHGRDVRDAEAMRSARLIECQTLAQLFRAIQPQLIRYPAIDAPTFERVVRRFCEQGDG